MDHITGYQVGIKTLDSLLLEPCMSIFSFFTVWLWTSKPVTDNTVFPKKL